MLTAFHSAVATLQRGGKADQPAIHPKIKEHSDRVWGTDPVAAVSLMLGIGVACYYSGRRASTLAARNSAVRSWEYFCATYGFSAYPATEVALICFAVWSASRIRPVSIRKYIGHVRMQHIEHEAYMAENKHLPRLMQVLDGLDWLFKAKVGSRLRLPVTFDVLLKLLAIKRERLEALPAEQRPSVYSMSSYSMSRAVYSLAFCGCLRPSEVSVRNNQAKKYTSRALRMRDIRVSYASDGKPEHLILLLPSRKNDQLADKKSDVAIGPTGHSVVCVLQAFPDYFEERIVAGEVIDDDSLLFPVMNAKGELEGLSYEQLTAAMDVDLTAAGFNAAQYNGHSWRIGAATTLALNGVPEYIIKDIGGWSRTSNAFSVYIGRTGQKQRAAFTAFLACPYTSSPGTQEFGSWNLISRTAST